MSTITDLQATIGAAAEHVGPAVVGFGRGWGRGSGVVVAPGRVLTDAHNLRGEEVDRDLRRTAAARPAASPASTRTSISRPSPSRPADAEPVEWDARRGHAPHRHAGDRSRQPGRPRAAGDARVRRPPTGRSFRGPRGRHDRRLHRAHRSPSRAAPAAGPLVDLDGRLLGLNAIRLDGGLIVAIPAGERLAERAERLWRGEPRAAVAARRRDRAAARRAPPAARGGPARARRAAGALGRRRQRRRGRAGIERGDLIVAAQVEPVDGRRRPLRGARRVAPRQQLELRVVRGTEERDVTVDVRREAEA